MAVGHGQKGGQRMGYAFTASVASLSVLSPAARNKTMIEP